MTDQLKACREAFVKYDSENAGMTRWEIWQAAWNTRTQDGCGEAVAVDTGDLVNDQLYLALDNLYLRGWYDTFATPRRHDSRGTNEWQAVLDIFRNDRIPHPRSAAVIGIDPARGDDMGCEVRGHRNADGSITIDSVIYTHQRATAVEDARDARDAIQKFIASSGRTCGKTWLATMDRDAARYRYVR